MNSTFKDENCVFVLSSEDAIPYLFTTYEKLFILLLVPTVVAFGLFGNVALLFVVYRDQDMCTITNFYLSNLAVNDAMLLSNSAFQYIWTYFAQPIDFSSSPFQKGYLCALNGLLVYLCYFASVFSSACFFFSSFVSMSCSDKCSVCSKRTKKNQKKLSCTNCKNYIHKSCSDLSWKDVRSKNIGKFWHCNRCTEDIGLPFNHIKEDIKFKLELYRMFENTPP